MSETKTTTFFEDYQNLIKGFERLKKSEDNPFYHSKYVPLNAILEVVKDNCLKNNFIFYQYPAFKEGKNLLVTEIQHKSGEKIGGSIELVSKDINDPQKTGAGLTYMRRYSLTCMFGLEEEDDDGNTASTPKPTNREQVASPAPKGVSDDDKPWISDTVFKSAIKTLVATGAIKVGMDAKEILKILRTRYKVAKKYEPLVDTEVAKSAGLVTDEIKVDEIPFD
jgi:hypothetical protein